MKELSIEEKEEKVKRYDEALALMQDCIPDENGLVHVRPEEIFPELKESEGEKIRNALVEMVHDTTGDSLWIDYNVHKEDALAWLEKKCEQKPNDTNNKFIRMRETKPKDISEFLDRLTTVEQEFLWEHIAKIRELDKEEQKPTDKVEPKDYSSIDPHFGKPVDKIEPKFNFKVSQWIVATGKCVYLIAKIDGFNVTLVDTNGDKYVFDASSLDDAHEWTIQDAKNGDVLFMDNGSANCIFIYKSSNNGIINKYASYNKFGFEGEHYLVLNDGYVIPATKEQRDTLEKAITDAGYTFDFEKKKLKKIESTEWSEEDERIIKRIDSLLYSQCKIHGSEYEEIHNWLKSLRPQSTWKPSDEQMETLEHFVRNVGESGYASPYDNNTKLLYSLLSDLKKLKE